ncbi:MAG: HAMP domain-containing histidine kinase [Oscillospiraceae bacterium]|nr:HAMP domain-containing histidine kinase [Oscillospiraceae bacterium]
MAKDVSQLKQVLSLLPTPAFFADGETVVWSNDACRALPLVVGDALAPILGKALPLYRERDAEKTAQLNVGVGESLFEATVRRFDEGDLFLLTPAGERDGARMHALAEGIRPALSELMAVGAKLFPQLEEAEDEYLQAQTAAISHACFRLLRTVGALQFFTHGAAARTQTDLTALLRELAAHTTDVLADANITLHASLPEKPVSACVDSAAIEYAVLQLIAHASARCCDSRTVELRAEAAGRWLRIRVSDHGGDMAADTLAAAFEPLGSTGLTLPIARAVAQQHGGSALIEESGDGVCVTMTVDLTLPAPTAVHDVQTEYRHGYDPAMVELSDILPPQSFDSRRFDI